VFFTDFVGDRSTRLFTGDGFVDFSRVVVDHRLQQLIVGVRYNTIHCTILGRLCSIYVFITRLRANVLN